MVGSPAGVAGAVARAEVPGSQRPAAARTGVSLARPAWWAWPTYLVLTTAAGLAVIDPGLVHRVRFVPLIVSLVVLGLPHGAVDHLLPGWVRGWRLSGRQRARLLVAYVALAAAGAAIWLIAPVVALIGFFVVTIVHWGSAELPWLDAEGRRVGVALARGLVPIAVPAVAFPHAFATGCAMLLSPFLARAPVLAPTGVDRIVLGIAVAAAVALGAGRSPRARLELFGLVAFFALVEPVFAVGVYFIAWHSWRHVLRLTGVHPAARQELASGRAARAVTRVLLAAVPCTLIALAGMAAFGAALSVHLLAPPGAVAVALAVIAALTVPHTLVVAWLDRAGA